MKSLRLKVIVAAIIFAITINVIIIYYTEQYEADYIIVKISGDADIFKGFINSLNEKGQVESIKFEDELPQEHKLKTKKVYCQIEMIKGEYLFVEYWSMGKLMEKDTVNSDLYKKIFSVNSENKREY